jgi:hypothetical protein
MERKDGARGANEKKMGAAAAAPIFALKRSDYQA